MSVLNYFKNTPGRPLIGRQALSVIFFLQICNKVPGKKRGPVAPATGDRVLSPPSGDQWAGPPTGAAGACRPLRGRQGGLSPPPRATGVTPLYKLQPPIPPRLSPKIPPKIQKKRERWGEGKRRNPAGFSICDLQVSTFSLYNFLFKFYAFK